MFTNINNVNIIYNRKALVNHTEFTNRSFIFIRTESRSDNGR